jgi:peptidoglycan/LPS O-acetylase OafA/YrhL
MEPTAVKERHHALDSLRAAMMLLGVYIHAIAPFSTIPDVWWYRDAAAGAAFDIQLLAIHAFRMPVFFAMAGFFGALLLERRGAGAFLRNRAQRVLLPLLACLALLIPLLKAMQLVHRLLAATGTVKPQDFLAWYPRMLAEFNVGPYWFLLYLCWFYLLALLLRPLARRVAGRPFGAGLGRAFAGMLGRFWAPSAFALASLPGLALCHGGVFPAPQGFLPDPGALLAYGPFVAFGWALYSQRQRLDAFRPAAWGHLGLGLLWMAPAIGAVVAQLARPAAIDWALPAAVMTGALCAWELLFGLLGLFQRYLDRPDARLRYVSDASFWIYLAHSPVLLALQLGVFRTAWPGSLKLAFVLALALPILFVSYHGLVRATWLGAWLNGRRETRGASARVPVPGVLLEAKGD